LWCRRIELPAIQQQRIVLLHLVGLALFLSVASGPRLFRLCTVAPPAIIICVWLVCQDTAAVRFVRRLLWVTALAFAVVLAFSRQVQRCYTLQLPIGKTAFLDPLEFREFQWLAQRTHPSDLFFNQSTVSFYLALDNSTSSEFINNDDFTRPE
jgi:hypothetical protein